MIKRIAINVFIVCHLSLILCWAMPLNTGIVINLRPKIAPYMIWSGLAQGWNLFAPNPLSMNTRMEADIRYRDGQTGVWKFPLPQDYGYIKRYTLERQHKFSLDSLLNDRFGLLRPDAARYIARLNNKNNNPPVAITFVSFRSQIAPPGSNLPEPWKSTIIGTFPITAGDLQ